MSSYCEKLERAEQCAILRYMKERDFKLLGMTPKEFSNKSVGWQDDLIATKIGGTRGHYLLKIALYERVKARVSIWTRRDFILQMLCTPSEYFPFGEKEKAAWVKKMYLLQWDRVFAKSKARYSTSLQRKLEEDFRKSEVGKLIASNDSVLVQKQALHLELLQKCVCVN